MIWRAKRKAKQTRIFKYGEIGDSEMGGFLHRVMVENSNEAYLLADEEKFEEKYKTRLYCMDISKPTRAITDRKIGEI